MPETRLIAGFRFGSMGIVTLGLRIAGDSELVNESLLVLFKGYPIAILSAHRIRAEPTIFIEASTDELNTELSDSESTVSQATKLIWADRASRANGLPNTWK